MTVDIDPPPPSTPNLDIESGTFDLLNLFDKHRIKTTFFVPAIVAEKYPTIMKEIIRKKHEIACHGLMHDPKEVTLNVDEEIRMIKTATEMIEFATGLKPIGFRAPLFRINKSCWMALQKNDYVYDSSIVCSPFYRSHKLFFSSKPFFLSESKTPKGHRLLEIPVSVNPFLLFPLGGAWMRIFGLKWTKIGVQFVSSFGLPVIFYVHPKDVIARTYGPSWHSYRNTNNCIKMLEAIIKYVKQTGAEFLMAYELAHLQKE
jgi:peptidoglycan/xylan/chitin deacetylase (PgdA/CDA1 family)